MRPTAASLGGATAAAQPVRPELARGAVPGPATGDPDPLDRRPAPVAGLPRPAVDLELALHLPRPAVGEHIVAQRRSLPFDSELERLADASVERLQLPSLDASRLTQRVDAGPPEGLVGIDVPDPG